MTDLMPLTALGARQPRIDRVGTLTLTEAPELGLASLAARRAGAEVLAAPLAQAFGLALPGPGMTSAGAEGTAAFWTGPGQWLVSAPLAAFPDLAASLKAAVGDAGSVTEQTDGWAAFELAGPELVPLFERLCNADLAAAPAGAALRSTLAHLAVILLPQGPGHLRLWTGRSSAADCHAAILATARGLAAARG